MGLFGVRLVFNHADFRCMSRRAIDALLAHKEVNIFIRGIVSELGFSSAYVYYERQARLAGETKYPLRKMLSFAWQGITSFSIIPLRLITLMGILLFAIICFVSMYVFYLALWTDYTVKGWASTILVICFLGSIQLISIGFLGEYIGKIYFETKQRPKYFVEQDTVEIEKKSA